MSLDQAEREQLKLLRLEHDEIIERIHYYSHQKAAIASPDHILSVIMDEILRLTLLHLEKQNKLPTVNPVLYLQLDTSDYAENL